MLQKLIIPAGQQMKDQIILLCFLQVIFSNMEQTEKTQTLDYSPLYPRADTMDTDLCADSENQQSEENVWSGELSP